MPRQQLASANNRSALLVLAALTPLAILASILAVLAIDWQISSTRSEAQAQATLLRLTVDRFLQSNFEALRILANSRALDNNNLTSFRDLADRGVRESKTWSAISLEDTADRRLVDSRKPVDAPASDIVDPVSYRMVLDTQRPVISSPTKQPDNPNANFIALRMPVLRDGKLRYVLTAMVDTSRFGELIESNGIQKSWSPFLADAAGFVVSVPRAVRPPIGVPLRRGGLEARRLGLSGTYNSLDAQGNGVVTAFSKSPETNWSAHIAIPAVLYNASLRQLQIVLAVAALLAIASTGLFIWLLKRDYDARARQITEEEHSRRLEAIGRMAGGVAHDFNNLLMAIQGSLAVLGRGTRDGERADRLLETARLAAERGATLTKQLLAFSRKQELKPEPVAIADVFAVAERLTANARPAAICFEWHAVPGLTVEADRAQFEATVLNLCNNARDALINGGRVRISAELVHHDGRHRSLPKGRFAVITVADNGIGMDVKTLRRATEPFFSTKGLAGTGLGLSTSVGFARQSHGDLFITSKLEEGTTVEIWLPAIDPPARRNPTKERLAAAPDRALRILVVDDDALVGLATTSALEDFGHQVTQASSGKQALENLAQGTFDVVVTDYRMPEMDGLQLVKAMQARFPGTPVLIVSGYPEAFLTAEVSVPVLSKPTAPKMLVSEINKLVEARRAVA